ncbi:hypothetical protein [Methylobacterium brachythecii]|uniref:Ni/Co efflux regulator RcnB n=1 Tax=Methylobacterium brachythecii TaxID=1176177 RepID=A0A7W6AHU1_9HYPH|nr:hypothetical protein [Methylobacterium brachythecii]MBB3901695.1 Ni/Co efflux regulator RcnB [Methylobacterium brachythecii]GLS43947.1 hypothetical protein GCM10007884_19330 [Methylobacterium brachythecii]
MRFAVIAVVATVLATPFAASAADGSRQAAGGGHMSSYITDPHHDPRSVYSQRNSTGQILGAPMFSEQAGAHGVSRSRVVDPHWAAGSTGRRAR